MTQDDTGSDAGFPGGTQPDSGDWVIPVPATGSPAFAVMPWRLFLRLRSLAQDAAADASALHDSDIAIRNAENMGLVAAFDSDLTYDEDAPPMPGGGFDDGDAIPLAVLDRLLDGEHPLKVFRRYRGLSQKELAERTGLNATYLSQIETRKRGGSTRVYRLLAAALNVDIGDLIE